MTRQLVGDAVPMRYLDSIAVKGSDEAIEVYAVDASADPGPRSSPSARGFASGSVDAVMATQPSVDKRRILTVGCMKGC
jgi:hypothetical protein